ncbi:cytochrome P450 [Pseudomassariella vexata]|uniref:Cytochrome P450 n=1 Tax=Pseudomassariella vexata TaxID=1141098 RepID=A0A1Y2DX94_9PEZI|nr:cytochrome P450 [Pseudomassariella vexata]ORY63918.1 cytochrome P450 [Pseudomassariella vexata]
MLITHTIATTLVIAVIIPIIYLITNEFIRSQARIPKLPGPRGLPVIGNLWDIRTNAAETYRQWARKYGDVYQIQLGNIPVVLVNSASAAKKIFSNQAITSRPEFYTFHKVLSNTAGTTIGTSPYSDSLKRRRKGAASALNRPSVQSYVEHLDVETRDFIKELLEYGKGGERPVDPMPMIQRLSLSLALTLNWGVRMDSQKSDLFHEITHVEEEISRFRSTTGNLQDYVPLLRMNPINLHSAKARDARDRRSRYLDDLNAELDGRMAAGKYSPCIQANVINDKDAKLNQEELTSISLTMLSGGLDTITTQVAWFCGLLANRPDIQDKALKEIRKFYSDKQPLCDPKDDQQCAYIVALVRESLRYFTVLRLALPKVNIKDIVYNNVVIPKGSIIFLNSWACNMDDKIWSDPEVFRPERFLEQPDAPMFSYGMGYRMCAGSLLANREVYLTYMRLLNSFRVQKHDEVETDPIKGNADPTSLVAMPKPYRALFVPREPEVLDSAIKESRTAEEVHGRLPMTSVKTKSLLMLTVVCMIADCCKSQSIIPS